MPAIPIIHIFEGGSVMDLIYKIIELLKNNNHEALCKLEGLPLIL